MTSITKKADDENGARAPYREAVTTLVPYNAGLGVEEIRRLYAPPRIAKLGSNENPYGPSPRVRAALADAASLEHYPDPNCRDLREDIARSLGVAPDRLIFGNGSEDILAFACRCFINPGDEVVLSSPTFSVYRDNAIVMGATIIDVPRKADLSLDAAATIAALTARTKLLFLCNPNNPTGNAIPAAEFEAICAAAHADTVIVADEAYYEYARGGDYPESIPMLDRMGKRYLALRTFSKAYGLAGLRVGYGVASESAFARHLDLVRTAFNVNRLAQIAARAAWSDQAAVAKTVSATLAERDRVARALTAMGHEPAPSRANFLFFDAKRPAAAMAQALLRQGVIVKPWGGDFATWLRVSIGHAEDNDQFLAAFENAARATATSDTTA
ncbi:MAG: histidinol-phosphate transaminase [Alphaproteobacteria bacterium]|nr:histidinol-phosphate transaminase [Alphaproteobacteria bacterium]MCA0448665.1 histidinol-phosphate transaminase [Pseudomonadota bacterium]